MCHSPSVDARTEQYANVEAVLGYQSDHPFEALAKANPLGALQLALSECEQDLTDYTCTFIKQERVGGVVGSAQEIGVKYRERPYSVLMEWHRNPIHCERLLYVEGRWPNASGGEDAWVDPAGTVANMILGPRGGIRYDIHKAVKEGKTRRAVDNFGFSRMLRLIVSVSERAADRGDLELRYLGRSNVEGRTTYLFERLLPYAGEGGEYADRLLLVHLDAVTRLPVAMLSYADDQRETLLGNYIIKDVTVNPGLPDETFSKQANGF